MAKSTPWTSSRRKRRAPRRETLETIAQNVRALRAHRHLSQDELAAEAGLNRSYIGELENARHSPALSTLECLATALGVTTIDLLTPSVVSPRKRNA
jgi:transcriptional regulator with XRE-family HTH domain